MGNLYGDDFVDVPHPMGGMATLPRSVAEQLGLAPPPATDLGMPAQTPDAAPPPAPAAPPLPTPAGQGGALGLVQQSADAQPPLPAPAPPPVQPMSTGDLRKMGTAGALNAETNALDQSKVAGEKKAQLEAGQQTQIANAYHDEQTRIDGVLQKQRDDAQADLAAIAKKQTDYNAQIEKYANTKIDRSVDHPVLAAIAVALGGLGSAMKNESNNPALDMLMKVIDRKVAGQMQDLGKQKEANGMLHDQIADMKTDMTSKSALYDKMMAAELARSQRQILEVTARSNSDIVKANGAVMNSEIEKKKAELTGSAVDKQHTEDRQDVLDKQKVADDRAHIAIGWAGVQAQKDTLAQSKQEHADSLAELKRQHDLEYQAKIDAALARGDSAKAKKAEDVAKLGVWNPQTGKPLLSATGKKMVEQADQLEADARSAKPDAAQKMREQAKALRDDSTVTGAATAPDAETARELRPKMAAAQTLQDLATEARNFLKNDPGMTNREGWAALKTKFGMMEANLAEVAGAKFSSREAEAIKNDILNYEPDDFMNRRESQIKKAVSSLDALDSSIKTGMDSHLKAAGIADGWVPDSPKGVEELKGSTHAEVVGDATPGFLSRVTDPSGLAGTSRQMSAENEGTTGPLGLSKQDTTTVNNMIAAAGKGNDAQRSKVVSTLASYAQSSRPGMGEAILSTLRATPDVYKEVLAQLPPDKRQQAQQLDAVAAGATPLGVVQQAAVAGDQSSRDELFRRAMSGDPTAKAAYVQFVQTMRGQK